MFSFLAVPCLQDIVGYYGTLIHIGKKRVTVTVLILNVKIKKITIKFLKL